MNEYSTDEVNTGVPDLVAQCAALELQLAQLHAASDAVFAAYHEILALFDCPAHGECAPYAIQKIKEDRALLAALESEVARLTAEKDHAVLCCLGQLDAKLDREKDLIASRALLHEMAAFTRHRPPCQHPIYGRGTCSCGLGDVLRRVDAEAGEAR